MTATEALREEVKKYIDNADDKSLRMVKAILEIEQEEDESSLEPENWDDLPKELQLIIDQGIKEGDEGNVMSYEQVKEKYSEWFRK
jgi:hypothetical protein